MNRALLRLDHKMEGHIETDHLTKVLYATDASVYRELPHAVAYPRSSTDIQLLVEYARSQNLSLIPRAAGTSLAGQCVGSGIVVDTGRYMNQILEFNADKKWIRVQPGVVRDELNEFLKPHGLFFSPITSTANRAMIGGMVGNNSSGTTSIQYGTTREHVLELKCILSDGSEVAFGAINEVIFHAKTKQKNLEGLIYRRLFEKLNQPNIQKSIIEELPKASIHRRNTGYAIDYLLSSNIFSDTEEQFNMCKLLCGSEGTLAFTTEVKINLDPLPPPCEVVVAAHFESIRASMEATQFAMSLNPSACELMDNIILDLTKENIEQRKNRQFIEGDPKAVLLVEFRDDTIERARSKAQELIELLKNKNLGYAYPIIEPPNCKGVWSLRSAGLGILANLPGDRKAVACIEDTAVALEDLPDYIDEFDQMMKDFGQEAVHYAHAGAGEIHLRPILDLKKKKDRQAFYDITLATSRLVKKYKGSLSGEHGDGRVRAPFIREMVGEELYQFFKELKATWDSSNLFNPGKIVDAAAMNDSLRYDEDQTTEEFDTAFNFDEVGGILRAAEKCNGSGDCRKLPLSGGTMCPSYQATRNEKDTTRARANVLREILTKSEKKNRFDSAALKDVMDLCISCKGCSSECPSNVDMSRLKAEFQYQYHKANGTPIRSKAFAYIDKVNRIGSLFPVGYNILLNNKLTGGLAKRILGVAPQRSIPTIQSSLKKWYKKNIEHIRPSQPIKSVYLFCDEFTNRNDTHIGKKAIQLLSVLGYDVVMVDHAESGRAAFSKGLLDYAKKCAERNVQVFSKIVSNKKPLIGIEPSAILSFIDEYPDIVDGDYVDAAKELTNYTYLIDQFVANEIRLGNISKDNFTTNAKNIVLHGHCHQKALTNIEDSIELLSHPSNYNVELIPSGCCGMAGSFGYEKEHYEVSQQIGELVLFPALRNVNAETIIAAPGTSCRHQIKDGVQRTALHPVEILYNALK